MSPASQPIAPRVVRFGLFEMDVRAGVLLKQGQPVKLQDQPLQILILLLASPGELVSREQLRQALWPADTFVEFDQGLNTAIKKVRVALGDSADNPRFIETVPRKGYRFIAPVSCPEPQGADSVLSSGAQAHDVPQPLTSARRIPSVWAALAMAVLVAVGAAWFLIRHTASNKAPVVTPLTSYPGFECCATFSPDGTQIAFWWSEGDLSAPTEPGYRFGTGGVYMKVIGEETPLRLAGGGANDPAWSSDGRRIAFVRPLSDSEDKIGIFVVPAVGGTERKIADMYLAITGVESFPGYYCCGMTWDSSSKWLVIGGRVSRDTPAGLFLVSVDTGEIRRLTTVDGIDESPSFSPDGRKLAFIRGKTYEQGGTPFLMKISGALRIEEAPRPITGAYAVSVGWLPSGNSVLLRGGDSISRADLTWLGRFKQLMNVPSNLQGDIAVSRQGRVAYQSVLWDTDIWRLELNGTHKTRKPPERMISSTYQEINPQYSPDGTRIAFSSNRSGVSGLWVCASDGSHPVQVASLSEKYLSDPYWSPDGTYLAFKVRQPAEVWTVPASGGRQRKLIDGVVGPWSRDGKWIYFGRDDGDWKIPASGGAPVRLSTHPGSWEAESPDGRFRYYTKSLGTEMASLWRVPVAGGGESQILDSFAEQYAVTETGIYFFTRWNNPELKLYRFDNGQIETIAQVSGTVNYGFSVSPDGRCLLYSRVEHPGGDLMLIENLP